MNDENPLIPSPTDDFSQVTLGGVEGLTEPEMMFEGAMSDDGSFSPAETLQEEADQAAIADPARLDHIMTHMLRVPDFMARVGNILNTINYFTGDLYRDAIYSKALAFYNQYGKLPSREALSMELRSGAADMDMTASDAEHMDAKLMQYYTVVDLDIHHVRDLLRDIVKRQDLIKMKEVLAEVADVTAAKTKIEEAHRTLLTDKLEVPVSESPFDDLVGNLSSNNRVPTHIPWWDYLLDGGGEAGEKIGFLAPSGGGKSTLGLQLWIAQAQAGEDCVYLSGEQPMKGDFSRRMMVLAGNCLRKDVQGDWADIDEKIKADIMANEPMIRKHAFFFDFLKKEVTSIETLMAPVRELVEAGKKPRYVIIDWWGIFRDMLLAGSGASSESALRRAGRIWMKKLSDEAIDLGVRLVILHQLSGAAAEKGAKAIQSSHSAQEDKNFNNLFDWCFTCSKKDQNDMVRVYADKARRNANGIQVLKLDGPACKFTNVTNPDDGAEAQEMYGMSTPYESESPMSSQSAYS